jgi:hypothetical protein
MVKHPCPHCGELSISGLRRMCLGPLLPTRCSSCGGRVGVPWWSLVALVPWFIALGISAATQEHGMLNFWIGAFGAMGMFVVWGSVVPLVRR